ncbi:MAG: hypothetical protein KDD92_12685 [Caldilineaceae bacterium]|nr:hypothetical protein [Caldilineaceae bacterium]
MLTLITLWLGLSVFSSALVLSSCMVAARADEIAAKKRNARPAEQPRYQAAYQPLAVAHQRGLNGQSSLLN